MSQSSPENVLDLKGQEDGATIYVLGSGATLDFIDPRFFEGKIAIGTNAVPSRFRVNYCFSHHWRDVKPYIVRNPETTFVVNRREWPSLEEWKEGPSENLILNEPRNWGNRQRKFDPFLEDHNDREAIIFGSSAIHGSIHLAAHLGARWIVLVGADNARLDGRWNMNSYPGTVGGYPVDTLERHLRSMKKWVKTYFGADVYSLNPFLNCHLEGHVLTDRRVGDSRLLSGLRFLERTSVRMVSRVFWPGSVQ